MLRNKYIREFVTAYAPEDRDRVTKCIAIYGIRALKRSYAAEQLTADDLEAIMLADKEFGSAPPSLAASPVKGIRGRSKAPQPKQEEEGEEEAGAGIAYPKPSHTWRDGDKKGGSSYRPSHVEPSAPVPTQEPASQQNPVYPAWWPAVSPSTSQPPTHATHAPVPANVTASVAIPPASYDGAAPMWFVSPFPPPPGTMPLYQFPAAFAPQYPQQHQQQQQAAPVEQKQAPQLDVVPESKSARPARDASRATTASKSRTTSTAEAKKEVMLCSSAHAHAPFR
jgi:hypothetical protein